MFSISSRRKWLLWSRREKKNDCFIICLSAHDLIPMLCSSNFYVEFEFSVVYCLCFDNKAVSNQLKNTLLDYCFDIYGFLYSLPMHCTCRVIIYFLFWFSLPCVRMKWAISCDTSCLQNSYYYVVLFFITMFSLRMKWGCRGERSKVSNNVRLLRQREHITDGRTSQGQEEAAGLEQVWSEPGTSQRRIWFDQISLRNPRWQLPVVGGGQTQWTLQGGSGMGIYKVLLKINY